jgi:hypothetical protein
VFRDPPALSIYTMSVSRVLGRMATSAPSAGALYSLEIAIDRTTKGFHVRTPMQKGELQELHRLDAMKVVR